MHYFLPIFALLFTGCGAAISLTYTPPMTFGITVDMRTIPATATQPH